LDKAECLELALELEARAPKIPNGFVLASSAQEELRKLAQQIKSVFFAAPANLN